jgi:hypothetical protein
VLIVIGAIPWCGWTDAEPDRWRAVMYGAWMCHQAAARGIPVADLWIEHYG